MITKSSASYLCQTDSHSSLVTTREQLAVKQEVSSELMTVHTTQDPD